MKTKKPSIKNKSSRENKLKATWIYIIGAALLLAVSIALFQKMNSRVSYEPEVVGAPSLRFDKDAIDMGDIPLGTTVQAAFEFTNVGDQTLRFNQDSTYVEVVEGC